MAAQKKLLSLVVWMLLMTALCPGAQYAYSKRGGFFKGRGKGDDKKVSPSQSGGLSKQGLKWAGAAAAAGMLGGTGTGLGLGFLGKPKHGSKSQHGHKKSSSSSEQERQVYYQEGQQNHNQSPWRSFVSGAAPTNMFLTVGRVVPFLTAAWIRNF
ncbi:shadow of prion protein 2 [Mugil cephalus]|uniref:shadow of prion protein 2 n=1 Tax=Mugil cephalus TaxID=48193 RepID=UPI001FB81210|nr:shadow of prion protein 2 [Mugil cephalus]